MEREAVDDDGARWSWGLRILRVGVGEREGDLLDLVGGGKRRQEQEEHDERAHAGGRCMRDAAHNPAIARGRLSNRARR